MGEEVGLMTYDENEYGIWYAFRLSGPHKRGTAGTPIRIEHQQLDTTIEKNANLSGKATTTFVSPINGLRVVPFDVFRTLRVQSVTADGQPLPFIQEDKNDDADFAVICRSRSRRVRSIRSQRYIAEKRRWSNEGGGNYYPVSRENWYPNNPGASLGEYALYDMTFRIPKGMKMAATGELVSESNDGGQNVSVWKSEAPQTVAGFNFGRFKMEEVELTKPEYLVQSLANQDPPDWVENLRRATSGDALPSQGSHLGAGVSLGTMNTTLLNKKALAEGELAVELYTDYFGPSLFKHLQITQQTDCRYGQSWPELVWIPMCNFFDTTVRHQLGMDFGDRGYWKVVTPHEVAHQWWGHTVRLTCLTTSGSARASPICRRRSTCTTSKGVKTPSTRFEIDVETTWAIVCPSASLIDALTVRSSSSRLSAADESRVRTKVSAPAKGASPRPPAGSEGGRVPGLAVP